MSAYFILVLMLFMHVLDDYVLQAPCLCNLKQRSFWEKNAPERLYRFDYFAALFMHGFSWAFMIMLPIAFVLNFDVGFAFFATLCLNAFIHACIDDLKANQHRINLCVDKFIHVMQIIITFYLFVIVCLVN